MKNNFKVGQAVRIEGPPNHPHFGRTGVVKEVEPFQGGYSATLMLDATDDHPAIKFGFINFFERVL